MNDELESSPVGDNPPSSSLVEDLKRLADDGRTLAEAELHYQLARARIAGSGFGQVAAFGGLAAVAAWFALTALVIGLVIALEPHLTAWGSTALVTGVLLVLALILARVAVKRWRRMTALLSEEDTPS